MWHTIKYVIFKISPIDPAMFFFKNHNTDVITSFSFSGKMDNCQSHLLDLNKIVYFHQLYD